MPAGGSCLLGSLNLSEFVTHSGSFDFAEFSRCVEIAITGLNEVLEEGIPKHPLQEQRESVTNWRQCGLGIMGLADMLIKMHITYGSPEAIELCDKIGTQMAKSALTASSKLAIKYGPYPKFNTEEILTSSFYKAHADNALTQAITIYGLRNSQLLTIAPTGTLSTMLNISGGIEPIFANSYTRTTKSLHGEDVDYKVFTPIVAKYMQEHNIEDEEELPEFFVTSATIPVHNRIAMQSIWQKHIDASISSTVNLPEETTVEEVEDLYLSAWKAGLKGITIFRSGCKRTAILNTSDSKKEEGKIASESQLPRGAILNCSNELIGKKRKLQTGCGSLHVLGYFDPETGDLQEVYLSKGSTGGCQNFMIGLSRTISLLCRAGVDIKAIKDQLDSTGACPSYAVRSATHHDTSKGACCPMAIGNALVEMQEEMRREISEDNYISFDDADYEVVKEEQIEDVKELPSTEKCPECGAPLRHTQSCVSCPSCGYSKCG